MKHLLGGDLHLHPEVVLHFLHQGAIDHLQGPLPEGCVAVLSAGDLHLLQGAAHLPDELGVHLCLEGLQSIADGAAPPLFVGLFVHVQGQSLHGEDEH